MEILDFTLNFLGCTLLAAAVLGGFMYWLANQ